MKRVALISGASRGLGKTVAGFLAAQGYELVITARGAEALAAAAKQMEQHGGEVIAIAGDSSDAA